MSYCDGTQFRTIGTILLDSFTLLSFKSILDEYVFFSENFPRVSQVFLIIDGSQSSRTF